MKTTRKLQRGQAAVEMAVTLVVLIPVIFYALFLADLLTYRLDQTEAITSTTWDYQIWDYGSCHGGDCSSKKTNGEMSPQNTPPQSTKTTKTKNGKGDYSSPDHFARLVYCDHYSQHQNFQDMNKDCEDSHHRSGSGKHASGANLAAHVCWLVKDAHQVFCEIKHDDYMVMPGGAVGGGVTLDVSTFNSKFNGGGVFNCSARLGVMNYFMAEKFMQWFAQADVTDKKRFEGEVHGSGGSGCGGDCANTTSQNIVTFKEENFAVLHDPWATNWPDKIDGSTNVSYPRAPYDCTKMGRCSDNAFYERMKVYYDPAGLGYGGQAQKLGLDLVKKKLLGVGAIADGVGGLESGDSPMTPVLAFDPDKKDRLTQKFRPSAWGDSRVSGSYSSRKDTYFGWSPSKW